MYATAPQLLKTCQTRSPFRWKSPSKLYLTLSLETAQPSPKVAPFVNTFTDFTMENYISTAGSVVIVQLERFSYVDGHPLRNNGVINCLSPSCNFDLAVTVSEFDPDIFFSSKYSLVATINHSGTLDKGHYTAFVKDSKSLDWYFCNDKSVSKALSTSVNNTTSYLLFYVRN